jgi:hypothetical protein
LWPELTGQGEQGVLKDPATSTFCQVDAGQGTHADIPAARATLPGEHAVQLEAFALAEKLPVSQASHLEALAAAEYDPGLQEEHVYSEA